MRPRPLGQAIALVALAVLVSGCWPVGGSTSDAASSKACLAGATATIRYGGHPAVPVTRAMRITVPVGQPISVTYGGACPQGGRLYLSKPGPGSGLNAFTGISSWAGSPTQTWIPTESGVRNLDVAWACTGNVPCPLGSLGIVTVTTPAGSAQK